MSPRTQPDTATRQRLLDVAGGVFAEHGFRRATVREICRLAGANVASIHYHFGDKDGLYHAVLRSAAEAVEARNAPAAASDAGPEEELHAFVLAFLRKIYSGGVPTWLMQIMSREMFEPTNALEELVRVVHRPTFERLIRIVRRIGGRGRSRDEVLRCAQSVIAQCVFYRHAQPVLRLMEHPEPSTPAQIERLAHHIAQFSIAGIRNAASLRGARK